MERSVRVRRHVLDREVVGEQRAPQARRRDEGEHAQPENRVLAAGDQARLLAVDADRERNDGPASRGEGEGERERAERRHDCVVFVSLDSSWLSYFDGHFVITFDAEKLDVARSKVPSTMHSFPGLKLSGMSSPERTFTSGWFGPSLIAKLKRGVR